MTAPVDSSRSFKRVVQADGDEQGRQVVIAVVAAAQDFEEQIHLGRCLHN